MNKNVYKVAMSFVLAFTVLIFYLTYISQFQGPFLTTHPKNSRIWKVEESTIRGSIYDRNKEILVETNRQNIPERKYYLKESAAHIMGYVSRKYGKTGIEDYYDNYLLGITGGVKYVNYFRRLVGKPPEGSNLYLTIDKSMQEEAYRMLDGRKGAVVAIDPQTGAVLALVSSPSYDSNSVSQQWEALNREENSPLLNRATQGLYPPGSVIKIAMAGGALTKNPNLWSQHFPNPGYIDVEGHRIHDTIIRTNPSMLEGIAYSSNVVFTNLALELGPEDFYTNLQNFYFNKSIPFILPIKKSYVIPPRKLTSSALAQNGIGQGEMLVTPFHMALITAAIANKGIMMEPYLVQKITSPAGFTVFRNTTKDLAKPLEPEIAQLVTEGMTAVVDWGTGRNAQIPGVKVAGKTGSAQNPNGISHAWFVGFAPADNPKIAVAVILENQGAGGTQAAPIAKSLFNIALGRER
ncbi:penicillin-binding transpeptidase domain-containing protein [Bacillota bacterium LX-D]|nr:penicillin-binding transpeptidase domain-containing protein [Bacillota bacterium LX-D]